MFSLKEWCDGAVNDDGVGHAEYKFIVNPSLTLNGSLRPHRPE